MKISSKGMLSIAVVLSLLTSVLVYNYLKTATTHVSKDAVPVIIAKMDIQPKTRITPDMLEVMYVPLDYIQPGAVQDLNGVVGYMTREMIGAGEQILNRRLLLEGKLAGFTGLIPQGKRAVTVPVTEVTGVAGFIKPGDYVDIMVTFDQSTAGDYIGDVILQNILVLAVNHETATSNPNSEKDKKEPVKTATVTLAVDPADVHHLAVGDDRGKIRLALRPFLPEGEFVLTKSITARELMGKQPLPEKGPQDVKPTNHIEAVPVRRPDYSSNTSPSNGREIMMIRGTKTETVRVD